jgi:hypothetical protein
VDSENFLRSDLGEVGVVGVLEMTTSQCGATGLAPTLRTTVGRLWTSLLLWLPL